MHGAVFQSDSGPGLRRRASHFACILLLNNKGCIVSIEVLSRGLCQSDLSSVAEVPWTIGSKRRCSNGAEECAAEIGVIRICEDATAKVIQSLRWLKLRDFNITYLVVPRGIYESPYDDYNVLHSNTSTTTSHAQGAQSLTNHSVVSLETQAYTA